MIFKTFHQKPMYLKAKQIAIRRTIDEVEREEIVATLSRTPAPKYARRRMQLSLTIV